MKKTQKTPARKLSLDKDTLRQLASDDLAQVAGMIEQTRDTPCVSPTRTCE